MVHSGQQVNSAGSALDESSDVDSSSPHRLQSHADANMSGWATLFCIAGVAALTVVALVPVQAAVYILWPPPATVLGYFSIFQSNVLLGLLDLDLLLIVDQLLIITVLLGLYVTLRKTDESLMLIGTWAGLLGATLFIVAREATLSMYQLSQQYAAAGDDAQRATLVAAGQTLLTTYNGTSFSLGYFLSGLAMLLVSTVMLRGALFGRVTGVAGVAAGVTALVPASMGTVGFVLSFLSLLPLVIWLFLVGRRFLELRLELETAAGQQATERGEPARQSPYGDRRAPQDHE
jgi:hypothetical protein